MGRPIKRAKSVVTPFNVFSCGFHQEQGIPQIIIFPKTGDQLGICPICRHTEAFLDQHCFQYIYIYISYHYISIISNHIKPSTSINHIRIIRAYSSTIRAYKSTLRPPWIHGPSRTLQVAARIIGLVRSEVVNSASLPRRCGGGKPSSGSTSVHGENHRENIGKSLGKSHIEKHWGSIGKSWLLRIFGEALGNNLGKHWEIILTMIFLSQKWCGAGWSWPSCCYGDGHWERGWSANSWIHWGTAF